jgi:hypothetical protein
MEEIIPAWKIGGSLYFRLPAHYVRKFKVKHRDRYEFIPNADGTILRLIKVDEEKPIAAKAADGQEAPVAAE